MGIFRRLLAVLLTFALSYFALVARAQGPNDGLSATSSVDRGSPRRSFEGFLRAGGRGDFVQAAQYLDLRAIAKAKQPTEGPVMAEKLHYVLTHEGRFDVAQIPDDPDAAIPKGDVALEVAQLEVRDGPVPVMMTRAKFTDGVDRWVFARSTVAMAPVLYTTAARPAWGQYFPPWLRTNLAGNALWQWLAVIALFPIALLVARLVTAAVARLLATLARRTPSPVDDALVVALRGPLQLALLAVAIDASTGRLHLTSSVDDFLGHVAFSVGVVAGAWAVIRTIITITHEWEGTSGGSFEEEMARRRLRTRLAIFKRVAIVLVVVVAGALMLLQFEKVRAIGVSLLASAGLAGVVLGFAAQRSLGAIISGIQLSITQPIRIGDAVVVEGEFGTVETINLTQVVVALWDERRLVLPVSRFLEQPFQNWSKAGEKILGTVSLECDYATPVELLRTELRRIVTASKLWDSQVCSLQVTELQGRSITVRALVSAPNPGALWDLRCEVRERMVSFLHELEQGRYFPAGRLRLIEGTVP